MVQALSTEEPQFARSCNLDTSPLQVNLQDLPERRDYKLWSVVPEIPIVRWVDSEHCKATMCTLLSSYVN